MSPKPIEFEESRKQLIGQLKILIAWRSGYSEKHIGLCAEVQPVQHEVVRILEAWPILSSEPAITEAIATARQLLIEKLARWDVPPQERVRVYTLRELMQPPLTAFAPAGATWSREPDWGEWKPYEDEGDFVGLKVTGVGTPRLGQLVDAWYLSDGEGEPREIIEHWCVDFYQPEEHETNRLREAECFYRYSVARPDLGRVYTWIEYALKAEGGVSLGEAMLDGRAHGLLLPDEEPRLAQWSRKRIDGGRISSPREGTRQRFGCTGRAARGLDGRGNRRHTPASGRTALWTAGRKLQLGELARRPLRRSTAVMILLFTGTL